MGHKKLLLVLRQCPESPLFNKCKITVSKRTVPVKKALKMVQEVILDNFRMAEMESIKEPKQAMNTAIVLTGKEPQQLRLTSS